MMLANATLPRRHAFRVVAYTNGEAAVRVKFSVQQKVAFGRQLAIVGSKPQLGAWDLTSSLKLEWTDGHVWEVEAELPFGEEVEYKYVVVGDKGTAEWQPGSNTRLVLPTDITGQVLVLDDWLGSTHEVKLPEAAPAPVVEEEPMAKAPEVAPVAAKAAPTPVAAKATPAPEAAKAAPAATTAQAAAAPGKAPATPAPTAAPKAALNGSSAKAAGPKAGPAPGKAAGAMAAAATDALEDLTTAQIKSQLKKLGLPAEGRKMQLVDRLRKALK